MATDDEIETCIRAEHGRLVGVVALVTGSRALAEEAVQEAFARAWERSRRGRAPDHLAAWVVTVALNLARSGRRRSGTEQRAVARLASHAAVAAAPHQQAEAEVGLVVRAAVDGLARRQRDAVVLYYLLDLDVATVAGLLGVSPGTVKTALSRARSTLAEVLGDRELET